jgi:hypothetical protein
LGRWRFKEAGGEGKRGFFLVEGYQQLSLNKVWVKMHRAWMLCV